MRNLSSNGKCAQITSKITHPHQNDTSSASYSWRRKEEQQQQQQQLDDEENVVEFGGEDREVNAERSPGKFRFVLCWLILISMSLSMMSRVVLNVAIVEMTKLDSLEQPINHQNQEKSTNETKLVELLDKDKDKDNNSNKFKWSAREQNLLIGSFYLGFAPSMLVAGRLADLYGSKWLLFVCLFGSALVNLLTPHVAQVSFNWLVVLRVALGVFQATEMPSAYHAFNRWLSEGELSIFTALTKVSFAFGSLAGASLPGVIASLNFEWPMMFYCASFVCAIWCVIWLPVASSTPQESRFCSRAELDWIMGKKPQFQATKNSTGSNGTGHDDEEESNSHSANWLLIMCNPSVLALTLVKYTYNIGMDLMTLELAIYLRRLHGARIETISLIASGGSLMQTALVTLVGWLARHLVAKQAFGLTRTNWRKIFQCTANSTMALAYIALGQLGARSPFWLTITLVYTVYLAWMLGAGGESMVPYDLSPRNPATIVGVAQSFSVLSGLSVPALCDFVFLDKQTDNETSWTQLFQLIACLLLFGGLIFGLVLKAEPFLPGEVVDKRRLEQKEPNENCGSSSSSSNRRQLHL